MWKWLVLVFFQLSVFDCAVKNNNNRSLHVPNFANRNLGDASSTCKAKYWTLVKYFDGFPKNTDMTIREENLPPLKNGEFLAKAVFLSVDPYQRVLGSFPDQVKLGEPFLGQQIAQIVETKNTRYPIGKYVRAPFGWRTLTISNGQIPDEDKPLDVLPDYGKLPVSLGLGVLGMTGMTAYFGLLEVCKPKAGETIVISGAAGAVGNLVGQIAKIKGLTVIGIAGSDEKGKWLKQELGFDQFINYKKDNIDEKLKQVAPKGVDCYFDNVGGEISSSVLYQMNDFGRVAVCGSISAYNTPVKPKVTIVQPAILFKQLKVEGFDNGRWTDRFPEAVKQYLQWIREGKIKYEETVTVGFENTFKAFLGMLKGENRGKAVVKL
ncbi:prostaglandin reductase 1 [Diabrotica virgifera virgifera]|uniref:Prostaglandin reductase 1 n=1 Tax=Diabrotica virgifera virgifera TaxID=50390 RepID=A0A6P7GGA4_DIAVI|nr:prostaglandin reductase 1 [Diabrotica virgifera virgifera]